jgi:hypothetical protein
MARFTFAAMLIVGALLAAACVGDVGDSSGSQATPTSTSGRNTALDEATGDDAEAQVGGGQALDGGNSGSGTGVSSKGQALVPSAAMWSCARVEPESPPSGEPGWSEGSSGSSGGATDSGDIAPSGTAIAYPATPAAPLPMPSDPGQVEPPAPPPSDSGRLMITIYFSESVQQGDMDEVRALLERFGAIVPDAITMIFPPIISAELPSGDPSACKVIAGELLSKSYVRDVSCVPAPSEPPVPGDDGSTISTTPIARGTPSADGTSGIVFATAKNPKSAATTSVPLRVFFKAAWATAMCPTLSLTALSFTVRHSR